MSFSQMTSTESSDIAPSFVGAGISSSRQPNSLIEVWRFKRAVTAAKEIDYEEIEKPNRDFSHIDIDCESLRFISPTTRISNAISLALSSPSCQSLAPSELLTNVELPAYWDLINKEQSSTSESMKHAELVRGKVSKVRSREVNYLVNTPIQDEKLDHDMGDKISSDEIILNVTFLHPKSNTKAQEYQVLGTQYLSELRDKIYCMKDKICKEISLDCIGEHDGDADQDQSLPTSSSLTTIPSTDTSPISATLHSSFFFIEDTFYSDMRHPDNVDYASEISKWMKNVSSYWCMQPIQTRSMAMTKFEGLHLEIDKRYLYCHLGNCEHIMIFSSIRMATAQDSQHKSLYPKQVFQCRTRRRKCQVCLHFCAKYITLEDAFAGESPFYYCKACFQMAHYDTAGVLIHPKLKVIPYEHE